MFGKVGKIFTDWDLTAVCLLHIKGLPNNTLEADIIVDTVNK